MPGTIKTVTQPTVSTLNNSLDSPPNAPSPLSQSGVLYRPELVDGAHPHYDGTLPDPLASGLAKPSNTRSHSFATGGMMASAGGSSNQHSPHHHLPTHSASFSETDLHASNARERSSSMSQTNPSSYYTSTYYSSALSNLTAFPSSTSSANSRRSSKSVTPTLHGSPAPNASSGTSVDDSPSASSTSQLYSKPSPTTVDSLNSQPNTPPTASPAPSPSNMSASNANTVASSSSSSSSSSSRSSHAMKLSNFRKHLCEEVLDMDVLRQSSWNGIPPLARSISWKILLGYLPPNLSRRATTLRKRREEYRNYVTQYYDMNCVATESANDEMDDFPYGQSNVSGNVLKSVDCIGTNGGRSEAENDILRQIRQDVPRTGPGIPFFKLSKTRKSLERLLYIFAVRHTASGYVQGHNDLATPFYCVFLSEYLYANAISSERSTGWNEIGSPFKSASRIPLSLDPTNPCTDVWNDPVSSAISLTTSQYLDLEADVFGSLSKMIDKIQDNYTFAQPGIQRMVYRMKELVQRIDSALDAHLEKQHVQYIHFGMRWMNCLLLREMPMWCIIRIWDTYLSEDSATTAPTTPQTSTSSSTSLSSTIGNIGSLNNLASSSSLAPTSYTGFRAFHIYMCTAFLMRFGVELKTMPFQELVLFLQKLPTEKWGLQEVETLLAQAFIYKRFGFNK